MIGIMGRIFWSRGGRPQEKISITKEENRHNHVFGPIFLDIPIFFKGDAKNYRFLSLSKFCSMIIGVINIVEQCSDLLYQRRPYRDAVRHLRQYFGGKQIEGRSVLRILQLSLRICVPREAIEKYSDIH